MMNAAPRSKVLHLDNQDDQSWLDLVPYYHGRMERQQAECLLRRNGQYLMRTSGADQQLVVSCRYEMQFLHFIIHETDTQPKRYYFENKTFATVPELVEYHQQTATPMTMASGAVISVPVHRSPQSSVMAEPKCFPNDYLLQIHSGVSAIKLERQEFVPSLELDAGDLLLSTNGTVLARHLFRRNLKFFGFDHHPEFETPDGGWLITSGLELMLLPQGTQLRKDLIVRHECLKYFVIVTVLRAPSTETKFQLLRKWIEVADHLEGELHDHFGFVSIMCGLCFPKIHDSNLWRDFSCKHFDLAKMFENRLRNKLTGLLNGADNQDSNLTLPFFIRLCHIIECQHIVDSALQLPAASGFDDHFDQESFVRETEHYDQKIGLNNFDMDELIQLITIGNQIIDKLGQFEQNVKHLLFTDGNYSYPNETRLEQLFMTNFHVTYLKSDDDDGEEFSSFSHHHTDGLLSYQDFHRLELKWNNW